MRDSTTRVLEPSTGDGAFLDALKHIGDTHSNRLLITGVEHSGEALQRVLSRGLLDAPRAIRSDFLAVKPFQVDAVIGNPPYVRLRHLPGREARRALDRAHEVLGEPMDPSGSLWMPFVLHSAQYLAPGGRLAFVLPYDVTYVRYARPLWRFLGARFGSLRVTRVRERLFPEILQETVLLFADEFGGETDRVQLELFDTADDFLAGKRWRSEAIRVEDVVAGRRVFVEALMSPDLRAMLDELVTPSTVTVERLATIRIGYVTGDKSFFHPSEERIAQFGLPARSLRPAIISSRQLRGTGVLTSGCERKCLFLPPDDDKLTRADRAYIGHGEDEAVDTRYKCRVRSPWYRVPGVHVPDLIFPVFADKPLVLANDAQLVASNSLLCGYLRDGVAAESFIAGWYTSLTRLQLELHVHALGGGVFVLVPREVGGIRLPTVRRAPAGTLDRIGQSLRAGRVQEAFSWGDTNVLAPRLGLRQADIDAIEQGCETLSRWRTAGGGASRAR